MANIILVKHPKNWGLSEKSVRRLAEKALRKRGFKEGNVELSIIFVGREKAKKTNEVYRGKDYIPQVLGFPMSRDVDEDGKIRLGDIMICSQKVKYEARYQKSSIDKVLDEWLLHGVDNLLK